LLASEAFKSLLVSARKSFSETVLESSLRHL